MEDRDVKWKLKEGRQVPYSRFEELQVWQLAHQLARRVYEVSRSGEFARDFGLRDQMRRAAVSVMSNIAEGFESRTRPLFIDYLGRAKGSAGELRAQCYIASDAGYLTPECFRELLTATESCSRQLQAFMAYLQSHPTPTHLSETAAAYAIEPEGPEASDLPSSFFHLPSGDTPCVIS